MDLYERIAKRGSELFDEAVEVRRQLHKWPEEGLKEFRTSAFVADYLRGIGLDEVRTNVAVTGVIGTLKGALPGPTVAMRADMDGLPITEQTELSFKSERDGWMHACGHDSHTAGLLLTAKLLTEMRQELPGTVKFLFQPAEEGPGGAEPMVKEGAMKGVDFVIGGHVWGDHLPGQAALVPGPMFAAPDEFRIKIQGVGGHAAFPHIAVDTIPIAASIVSALQTVVSRRVEPGVPCVVTVGELKAGYRYNVIADVCLMTGTVRTFDPDVQETVKKAIFEIVEGIASSMGAKAEIDYITRYPVLVNDAEVTRKMRELAELMLGKENVIVAKPTMGGEDFAYFLKEAPGTFIYIGSANEGGKYWNEAHHPCFNIDERAMLTMMKLYAAAPFHLSGEKK